MTANLLALIGATIILLLIPGPNVAIIVATSLRDGLRYGLITALGTTAGLALQLALVVAGMAALIETAAIALTWIKWAGVIYLVWLGIRTWNEPAADLDQANVASGKVSFWRGFGLAVVNPKTLLFDAAFLDSLQGLRIIARRVPRGGRHADQRSLDLGSGIEFRDFRPYSPGDDFRAIDWNIYRRLGRVFLRLFEELEDLPLYLMPDVSDSMFQEDPPRAPLPVRGRAPVRNLGISSRFRTSPTSSRIWIVPFRSSRRIGSKNRRICSKSG